MVAEHRRELCGCGWVFNALREALLGAGPAGVLCAEGADGVALLGSQPVKCVIVIVGGASRPASPPPGRIAGDGV